MSGVSMEMKVEVLTPVVPSELQLSDGRKIPLKALTQGQLKKLGRDWVKKLLEVAEAQAKDPVEVKTVKAGGTGPVGG